MAPPVKAPPLETAKVCASFSHLGATSALAGDTAEEVMLFQHGFRTIDFHEQPIQDKMEPALEDWVFVADKATLVFNVVASTPGTYYMKLTLPGGSAKVQVNDELVLNCETGKKECEGDYIQNNAASFLPFRIELNTFDTSSDEAPNRAPKHLLFEIAKPGDPGLHPLAAVDFAHQTMCPPVQMMSLGDVINQISQNRHSWCATYVPMSNPSLLPDSGNLNFQSNTRYNGLDFNEHFPLGAENYRSWMRAPLGDKFKASFNSMLVVPDPGWYDFELIADPGTKLSINTQDVLEVPLVDEFGPMKGRYKPVHGGTQLNAFPIRNRLRVDVQHEDAARHGVLVLRYRKPGSMEYVKMPMEELSSESLDGQPGCDVDCVTHEDFGLWSQCDGTCQARGHHQRFKKIELLNMNAGKSCGKTLEIEPCFPDGCPCVMEEWSAWGECF